jgi:NAD(P)-dependent dehydrogenase (short-subunit alcohol dehydrogenase family)
MTVLDAFGLQGRTAVVTGACGYVGRSISRTLSSLGASLLLLDLAGEDGPRLARGIVADGGAATFIPVDLSSSQSISAAVAQIQQATRAVDVLVNNAAMVGSSVEDGYVAPFDEQSDAAFGLALTVNLTAPFSLTRGLLPMLQESTSASVINIASIYGLVGPVQSLYEGTNMHQAAAYAASKGGLIQLTRYLSTTLAPQVRVNAIAPGGIERGQDGRFVERYLQRTPMGRMAKESDLEGVVAWLSGDASSYVTGQVVAVDGGWTAW